MSSTRFGAIRLALFVCALCATAPAVAQPSLFYRGVGVRNDATAVTGKSATVVICTNIAGSDDIYVKFYNAAGTEVCSAGVLDSYSNNTYVFATQPVEMFPGAGYCGDPGPSINQGMVVVSSYTTVACTAFLVDPNTNPPTFMASLELQKLH